MGGGGWIGESISSGALNISTCSTRTPDAPEFVDLLHNLSPTYRLQASPAAASCCDGSGRTRRKPSQPFLCHRRSRHRDLSRSQPCRVRPSRRPAASRNAAAADDRLPLRAVAAPRTMSLKPLSKTPPRRLCEHWSSRRLPSSVAPHHSRRFVAQQRPSRAPRRRYYPRR